MVVELSHVEVCGVLVLHGHYANMGIARTDTVVPCVREPHVTNYLAPSFPLQDLCLGSRSETNLSRNLLL
jgi:hypothetical protein